MESKDFLNMLYNYLVKPIFNLGIAICFFYFLPNEWKENYEKVSLVVLGSILIGLLILMKIQKNLSNTIWNSFSPKNKSFLTIINKVIKCVILPFLIYFSYMSWNVNKTETLSLLITFLIISYSNTFKTTKSI
jgi:hypothetical protein